jgi:excisionase family DNA binding protein
MRKSTAAIPVAVPVINEPIWTKEDAAAYLKVSPRCIYELMRRRSPRPLPSLRCGRYLRFLKSDIDAWLLASRVN